MGKSKDLFMEQRMEQRMKCEMNPETYKKIPINIREEIDIKSIDHPNFPYENDEIWKELRKVSAKAYSKLKDREFELIHNQK